MWQNFHKIALSLLAVFIGISFLVWPNRWAMVFSKSDSKIIEMEVKNKQLEEEKKALKNKLFSLEQKFISDSLLIDTLKNKVKMIDDDLSKVDGKIKLSKYELMRLKRDQAESKSIIDRIKNSPNKKTGDDLLHSMDKKLKGIK